MRIKKRSSLDSGLTGDKVPDRHNEATSRGGSEVSEKPTTKADDYYSIASDNSILQSNEKSQEKNVDIQENILSDDQRASISDAGMRLTDDTELSSLMRENADYKAEIERLKGEFVKSKRMGGKVPLLDRNADSTQEMWRNLIEVRDSLDENTGFNPYLDGGEFSADQTAAVLGADILERFNEVRADTTFADRAQQRVDLREQKISELKRDARISELKESFREQNRKKGTQKKSRCFSGFFECQRAV